MLNNWHLYRMFQKSWAHCDMKYRLNQKGFRNTSGVFCKLVIASFLSVLKLSQRLLEYLVLYTNLELGTTYDATAPCTLFCFTLFLQLPHFVSTLSFVWNDFGVVSTSIINRKTACLCKLINWLSLINLCSKHFFGT